MNRRGKTRYTGQATSVSASYSAITFSGPRTVTRIGEIYQVSAEISSGSGTQVALRIKEDGNIIVDYPLSDNPLSVADTPVHYEVTTAANFVVEVAVDAGSNSTVDVVITIGT